MLRRAAPCRVGSGLAGGATGRRSQHIQGAWRRGGGVRIADGRLDAVAVGRERVGDVQGLRARAIGGADFVSRWGCRTTRCAARRFRGSAPSSLSSRWCGVRRVGGCWTWRVLRVGRAWTAPQVAGVVAAADVVLTIPPSRIAEAWFSPHTARPARGLEHDDGRRAGTPAAATTRAGGKRGGRQTESPLILRSSACMAPTPNRVVRDAHGESSREPVPKYFIMRNIPHEY